MILEILKYVGGGIGGMFILAILAGIYDHFFMNNKPKYPGIKPYIFIEHIQYIMLDGSIQDKYSVYKREPYGDTLLQIPSMKDTFATYDNYEDAKNFFNEELRRTRKYTIINKLDKKEI